jgi:hypothetical protein
MRRILQRWRELPPLERTVLRQACTAAVVYRARMLFVPWKRLVAARPGLPIAASPADAAALVRWAVSVTARCVPLQNCLSTALVARDLLARFGVEATLEVGTYREASGAVAFHAAVRAGGVTVCGEREMTVLASIPSA